MSEINEIEVHHRQAEKEKLRSEDEREEPIEQQSGGSQSIDYHSSDGGADDSQAKPVTSDEGHRSDPLPFMLKGAGQEAAAGGGNNADATPNPNPTQQGQASAGFSNILGSLNTPTNTVEPATPMDERFQSVNADDIQDLTMNKTQFSNTNLPFAPQSIQNFESLLGNHNLSTSTLPSEFHQADISTGNNGLPNLETEWDNWKQFNMHDSAALLGPQDSQYQALLNQAMAPSSYQNMPLTQVTEGMEGFNMGSSCINPTYNYMEGFPVQGTKLVDWVSQAPGPEVQNNLTTLLHPDTPKPSSSRAIRNSVYDPMFEAMGLPVDPHLRMFMARRETGVE